MKKVLAITLSLLMVFTIIPMAMVSASSVAASKTIIDFEDGSASIISSTGDQPAGIVDTSTLAEAKDYWKTTAGAYCAKVSGKNQSTWFTLPTDWTEPYDDGGTTYARPNEISFDITGSENTSRGISITSIALVNSSNAETYLKALTKITSTHNAKITVSYKIPVSLDLSDITKFKMNIWGTNVYVYVDNIKVNYYDSFTATFSGTETAELASPVDSIDQNFTNGETSIVLPDATLANGKTFAGWVTEANSATVLPAGTEVSLEDDTTFYAVATDRGPYPTPDAPTVSAKTFNSVTLTALGSDFVYSKDGTTWQESNVFTSLEPSTEYTFYTKHIATLAYDESAVSEGTTVTTDVITEFIFSSDYVTLSDNTANLGFASNDGYPNISKTGLTAGKGVTVTTKYTVAPGVYDATLYTRSYAGRAPVDVEINGTKVAESLDTSSSSGTTGNNKPFTLGSIAIPETTVLTIKFTTTGSGSLYLNSLKLDKTGEYVPPETDGTTTDALTLDSKASIRLGTVSGIRFYTTFDVSQITGTVVEKGTLIGPADLVGDYLTIDDVDLTGETVKNAVAVPYKSDTLWAGNEFVGSIVGIQEKNYNRAFVARAYVKLEDGTYLYSSASTTKTVAEIADAFIADATKEGADENDVALYNAHKELVDAWAAAND